MKHTPPVMATDGEDIQRIVVLMPKKTRLKLRVDAAEREQSISRRANEIIAGHYDEPKESA